METCPATLVQPPPFFTTSTDTAAGHVLWRWEAPETLGPPIVADIEGRGEASILVGDHAGTIYALCGL